MTEPRFTELEMQAAAAERALLAAVIRNPDALAGVLASLPGSDFYSLQRGIVWDVCRELSAANQAIASVTVARTLLAQGKWGDDVSPGSIRHVVQVEMVQGDGESPLAAGRHADLVAELARRRELIRSINYMRQLAAEHDGTASDTLAVIRGFVDSLGQPEEQASATMTWLDMFQEFEAAHTGEARPGIPTPWTELDALIGGLFGGRLYVIGGSPGDGKSTVALNIALHAALLGHQVLAFSAEMPTIDVFGRVVSRPSEVPLHTINRYKVSEFEMSRIRDYVKAHHDLPLRVNAENTTINAIISMARAQKHRRGLDVLIVDYLQLIGSDANGRSAEEEIAKISTALKRLSRELDCAVIVPAQLNRNPSTRANSRPVKADLRGSGRIEQDADVALLLWHEEEDGKRTGDVTFIVDKNRHGPRGDIRLPWDGEFGSVA